MKNHSAATFPQCRCADMHDRRLFHFMFKQFLKQSTGRILAEGFIGVILLGAALLLLPVSLRSGASLSPLDALYTATSAVCVTGLTTVDVGATFSPIGYAIIALLIQIGGLGIASVSVGFFLALRKRVNLKERRLIRDALNLDTGSGLVRFVQHILIITFVFEAAGAALCFPVFARTYPPLQALGVSIFHSIASFNNAGFDIFGNYQSLAQYSANGYLLLITSVLIVAGGIGFLVIGDLWVKHGRLCALRLQTKVVLAVTAVLLLAGAVLLKCSSGLSWSDAFFYSVSARTAGFATVPLSEFSAAGLLFMVVLMFVGASPGSTGGGVKTTTLFILFQGIRTFATNKRAAAFHYSLPWELFQKASVITMLGGGVIALSTFLLACFEPQLPLSDVLVEMTSAFGTVGLSTGITPQLGAAGKLLSICVMFIGRLGPLTVATLWYFGPNASARYPEGTLSVG